MTRPVKDDSRDPLGYQQLTSLAASTALTVPNGAKAALIQVLTQNVRVRDDGVDPTSSVGYQIAAGTDMWYFGDLLLIKLIEETASSEANILFYE